MDHSFIEIAENIFSVFVFEKAKLFYYVLNSYDPSDEDDEVFSVENVDEKAEITCFRNISEIKALPMQQRKLLLTDLILYGKLFVTLENNAGLFWRNAIMEPSHETDIERHNDKYHNQPLLGGRFLLESSLDANDETIMEHLESSLLWPYISFHFSPIVIMTRLFEKRERRISKRKHEFQEFTAKCQDKCDTLFSYSFPINKRQSIFLCNVFKEITNYDLVKKFWKNFWKKEVLTISFDTTDEEDEDDVLDIMRIFECLKTTSSQIQNYSIFQEAKLNSIEMTDDFEHFIEKFIWDNPDENADYFHMLFKIIKPPKKQRKFNFTENKYQTRFPNYEELLQIAKVDHNIGYVQEEIRSENCLADFVDDDCDTCKESPKNPQFRCLAICKTANSQCKRNRLPNKDFCLQHFQKGNFFPIHKFQTKYDAYNDKGIDKHEYGKNPLHSSRLLRYPLSQRPINSTLQTISKGVCSENEILMPVYRVHSLYHNSDDWDNDPDFCGKFWFYDKDSPLFLKLGKTRVFGTKLAAYASLYKELVDSLDRDQTTRLTLKDRNGHRKHMYIAKEEKIPAMSYDDQVSINYIPFEKGSKKAREIAATSTLFGGAKLPPSVIDPALEFTPLNHQITPNARKNAKIITNYFGNLLLSENKTFQQTFKAVSSDEDEYKIIKHYPEQSDLNQLFPSVPFYLPDNAEPVKTSTGQLDFLDGSICKLAALLGIETIVLQHEVGSFDCVTEILDARENSVDNICSLDVMTSSNAKNHRDKFPKIWFLENKIIVSRQTLAGVVGMKRSVKINIGSGEMLIKSTETDEFQAPQPGFFN